MKEEKQKILRWQVNFLDQPELRFQTEYDVDLQSLIAAFIRAGAVGIAVGVYIK